MGDMRTFLGYSPTFLCYCVTSILLLTTTTAPAKPTAKKKLNPVILVPGDGGSQFEAVLDKPEVPHIWCEKKTTTWFSLWLNLELLAPYILDCTVDNLRLVYNRTTHTTSNSPGVKVRQPQFGNTSAVEWLDPSQFSPTSYFYHIAEALVSVGYVRNKNIRGAPYDFRKAPNEQREFLDMLKALIEETYEQNNNTAVHLIGHSMGNPYILYLLNQQSKGWKSKYIRSFISLSGPYGGAVKTIRLMASGDNLGVFVVNPLSARPQQRSMPSSAWLLPYDTFWDETEVLVSGPKGNYTVKDYARFFKDINFEDGYMMRQDTEHLTYKLTPPGVEVWCLHGTNVSTPASLHYTQSQWYDDQPTVTWGNGDGTVNQRSLYGCLRWQGKQSQPVHHQEFSGVDHMEILNYNDVLDSIKKIVSPKQRKGWLHNALSDVL